MKAEVIAFTVRATGRSVARRLCWSARQHETGRAVASRRSEAIVGRSGSSDQAHLQGKSAGERWLPNPRLQATRPGAQLLGGLNVAHHHAMHAVIAVVGARLKRSVRLHKGVT